MKNEKIRFEAAVEEADAAHHRLDLQPSPWGPQELSPLIRRIAGKKVVLLGESTHGTQEFYLWRRLITEWLVVRHGFSFVAVEGDWPACSRFGEELARESARQALNSFSRWPTWMWANTEVARMGDWLRTHNQKRITEGRKGVGFHGLDVYSLFESIQAVLAVARGIDPGLEREFRNRYSCFFPFHGDEHRYARSLFEDPDGCENAATEALVTALRLRHSESLASESMVSPAFPAALASMDKSVFDLQQNARIVRNAERYYRTVIHADEASWNVRDRHMLETLVELLGHYGPDAKAVVWAHNTHIGDYRATDMMRSGLVNFGGLAREEFGRENVALVGFSTHEGTVIASHAWEGPIERMKIPKALPFSLEAALHSVCESRGHDALLLYSDELNKADSVLRGEMIPHRAIGVVYDPAHERFSNYVPTRMAERYDAFCFIDRTTALEPFVIGFDSREMPETWPRGA